MSEVMAYEWADLLPVTRESIENCFLALGRRLGPKLFDDGEMSFGLTVDTSVTQTGVEIVVVTATVSEKEARP